MPVFRTSEVRLKGYEDLRKDLEDSCLELMNLRFRWATHQLENHNEIKRLRRSIARIKTVLRERELGIE